MTQHLTGDAIALAKQAYEHAIRLGQRWYEASPQVGYFGGVLPASS